MNPEFVETLDAIPELKMYDEEDGGYSWVDWNGVKHGAYSEGRMLCDIAIAEYARWCNE